MKLTRKRDMVPRYLHETTVYDMILLLHSGELRWHTPGQSRRIALYYRHKMINWKKRFAYFYLNDTKQQVFFVVFIRK